ncbi:hypothetical protein QUA30_27790, partial [Microcoleus sp. Pol14C2]|uniref:hypothetical protein n=1 Tax=unclassified Microcoleus TaxID=2642155 RepID=UPI002FD3D316
MSEAEILIGAKVSGNAQAHCVHSSWHPRQAVLLKLLHSAHSGCQLSSSFPPPRHYSQVKLKALLSMSKITHLLPVDPI